MTREQKFPRIVLAGVSSGVGKTTIVTGLLRVLRDQGLVVQPFKVGPDYIDPGFHEKAAGRNSYNLDTWLVPEERLVSTFCTLADKADISVIEGVMGLFDGGEAGISSTAHIARLLNAPVVLVVNCRSMGQSAAAVALGYKEYAPDVNIAGVILNQLGSDNHEQIIREAMTGIGMPVLGALHRAEDLQTPERHLGLTPVTETETDELIAHMAETIGLGLDLSAIKNVAKSAPPLSPLKEDNSDEKISVRIGVAKDEAFTFYYPTSLSALSARGADLIPFSPLLDKTIPPVDGLLFGGGFPEMFLDKLAANVSLKASVRKARDDGMPIFAECGGLMYLCQKIFDFNEKEYEMVGLVPAVCRMQKKLQRVGYVTAKALRENILTDTGETLRGHEFHFSTMEPSGSDFPWAYELTGSRQKESHREGYASGSVLASYLHINFDGSRMAAERFLSACRAYQKNQGDTR